MGGCGIKNVTNCDGKPYPRDPADGDAVQFGLKDCDGNAIDNCDEISRCPKYANGTDVPTDGNGHPVIPRVRVANKPGEPLYPESGGNDPDQLIGLSRSDGAPAEYNPATGVWQQQGIVTPSGQNYPFGPDGNQIIGITGSAFNPATGEWTVPMPPESYCVQMATDLLDTGSHQPGELVETPVATLTNPSSERGMCVLFIAEVQVGVYTTTGGRGFIQPYWTVNGNETPVWGQQTNGPATANYTEGESITFAAQHDLPPGGSVTFRVGVTVVDNPAIQQFYPTSLNARAFGVTGEVA